LTLFCLSFNFMEQSLRLRVVFWIGVRVVKRGVLGVAVADVLFELDLVILPVVVLVGVVGFAMMEATDLERLSIGRELGWSLLETRGLVSLLAPVFKVWWS
jgi:hypothetical protein